MTRKACRRRHYALMNPIDLAISGATITSEADLDKLRLRELSAIESFTSGTGTPDEFRDIADMLNLAETMALSGIGPEVLPACERAQRELLASKDRHDRTGVLGMGKSGLKALRDLFEWHDLQRTSIDRRTYEVAIKKTVDRIRGAHPDVKVLV